MTMSADVRRSLGPENVFDTLKKSILVDGFHVVVDLEKSHGSVLIDARDGKEYLDFYTYFATLPVGHNHPRTRDPEFEKKTRLKFPGSRDATLPASSATGGVAVRKKVL